MIPRKESPYYDLTGITAQVYYLYSVYTWACCLSRLFSPVSGERKGGLMASVGEQLVLGLDLGDDGLSVELCHLA